MALIHEKLASCVAEIGAVGKDRRCQAGATFAFRGIDDALDAVHTVFGKHGIIVLPTVEAAEYSSVKTTTGKDQICARLTVRYSFVAGDGSAAECLVIGEAFDSSDKATSKAASVALRTAIWQVFTVPLRDNPEDREPDYAKHDRAGQPMPVQQTPAKRPAPRPAPAPTPAREAASAQPQHKTLADDPALRAAFHACGVSVYGDQWDAKRTEIVAAMKYRSSNEIPASTARQAMACMQEAKKTKETNQQNEVKP